jgi:hypothetical protein
MELFVASDRPIDLSPGWKGEPFLTVEEARDTDVHLRPHLTLTHVRSLGAHTGCSCGFEYGVKEPQSDEDAEQDRAGRRSVAALRDFLETQLKGGASLELLSRWFTEGSSEPVERREVSAEYFGGEAFELPQSTLLLIRRAVEQRDEADKATHG